MNFEFEINRGPHTAIILAAGMGTRLRSIHDKPKGLLEIGDESLVARSIRHLRDLGVQRFVIVVGWKESDYEKAAKGWGRGIQLVTNHNYASTGSLASLRLGAAASTGDVWLLESDLIYHPRALREVLESGWSDVVLASGPTKSGDEVWVHTTDAGNLSELTKTILTGKKPVGELVGVCRITRSLLNDLSKIAEALPPESHYEDGLTHLAGTRDIPVRLVSDLVWGEIDSPEHYDRVIQKVWPLVRNASVLEP